MGVLGEWGRCMLLPRFKREDTTTLDAALFASTGLLAALCYFFPSLNVVISALVMLIAIVYFGLAWKINRSPLSGKAVFVAIWIFSFGLALLRLHPLQEPWCQTTWLCIIGSLGGFLIGYDFVSHIIVRRQKHKSYVQLEAIKQAVFPGAAEVVVVLFGIAILIAFVADVLHSGYIPILSSDMSAYMEFGMQYVHYLTVCSGIYPALVTSIMLLHGGVRLKKSMLTLALITGLIPALIVSRQLVMMELFLLAVSVLVATGAESRIRWWMLAAAVGAAILFWGVLSLFRNQSPAYLAEVFELRGSYNGFEASMWQLYLYIGFNFDNFDYMIQNISISSGGAATLFPIAVLCGLGGPVKDVLASVDMPYKLATYNTFSIMKDPYIDWGLPGVIMYLVVIGVVSALIEWRLSSHRSAPIIVIKALFLYALAISFFTSQFSQPIFWVYCIILGIISFFDLSEPVKIKEECDHGRGCHRATPQLIEDDCSHVEQGDWGTE